MPYTVGWAWGWWKFGLSTLLIILLWRWATPKTVLSDLGLRWHRAEMFIAGLTVLVVGIVATYAIPFVLREHGYLGNHGNLMWKFIAIPFQTLNEEMVLRALLLTGLAKIVKVRLTVSVAVALVFTVLHFVLYRLGPPQAELSIQALVTLFFIGLAFNELFLATGSIAVPLAIHLGWNITRFGNNWIQEGTGDNLPQGMDFNFIEGNPRIVALAVVLGLFALTLRARRRLSLNQRWFP